LIPFLLFFSIAILAQEKKEPIRATDLLKIKQLRGVTVSKDGKQVAYVIRSIEPAEKSDSKKDPEKSATEIPKYEYRNQLYVASLDGTEAPRQLTFSKEGAAEPVWDPDGKQIAFVRTVDDKSQIFVLPLTGGEAWQLTKMKNGASSPRWSPDGKQILFASEIPQYEIAGKENAVLEWPAEKPNRKPGDVANWKDPDLKKPKADPDGNLQEIREWLARNEVEQNPRVLNRLRFLGEMDLEPVMSYTHFYTVDVRREAEPRAITKGFYSFDGGEWMPDGKSILLSGFVDKSQHPDRVLDSDLYIVNADGSGLKRLLDFKGFAVFAPLPAPDGSLIAFAATELEDPGYALTAIGVVRPDGAEAVLITDPKTIDVGQYEWSTDNKQIYFTAPTMGAVPLYRVASTGGEPQRLTGMDSGVDTFDLSAQGIAYVKTEVANPYELYAANLDAGSPKQLSSHNSEWLKSKLISFPEPRKLTREDGWVIEYWIMKPSQFEAGKKYPLLVEMHGGPSAMWGPGEDTTWHEFQMFCSYGYGIVYSNPRGSGGYGKEFQRANFQNWGEGPAGDVLAAATEAAKEPWVDDDKQVLTGGSYAGYLTAWIVGHDQRFKAAVAQRGVYDLNTFFGEANAWRLVPYHHGGYPWQAEFEKVLQRESPITYVDNIKTPLMIKHGDNDLRAGVIQSEMLYKSLKVLGRPVEYVRYPKASHELSRSGDPTQRIDRLLRFYEFFERHIH
jgi:dipeptidyl aminopeptidase/acylaminoacyl peptidase